MKMKWILKKSKKKRKTKNQEIAKNILEVQLKKQNIDIYQQKMIDYLLLKMINRDLDKLINKIVYYLASEDNDDEETALLFDELAKLRGIYREYDKKMSEEATLSYMKKVRFAAFELKKRILSYEAPKVAKGRGR